MQLSYEGKEGEEDIFHDSDSENEKDTKPVVIIGNVAYEKETEEDTEEEKEHGYLQESTFPILLDVSENIVELKPTNNACWWDCHPFDTIPFVIPKRYDEKRKKYIVYGNFCSPNCAKAYMYDSPNVNIPLQMSLFKYMLKKVYQIPIGEIIHAAPPRQLLYLFNQSNGYNLKEFREKSKTCSIKIMNPPLIAFSERAVVQKRQPPLDFASPPSKKMKLQRNKPLPNAKSTIGNYLFKNR